MQKEYTTAGDCQRLSGGIARMGEKLFKLLNGETNKQLEIHK